MEKRVRESQFFVAWLLFWSCSLVAGFLAGGVAGLVIGAVLTLRGVDLSVIQIVCGGVGFLLGIPISYVFFGCLSGCVSSEKPGKHLHVFRPCITRIQFLPAPCPKVRILAVEMVQRPFQPSAQTSVERSGKR